MRRFLIAALFGLTTALAAGAAHATTPGQTPAQQCFASSNWRGWSAPGNGDVLYIRVRLHEYYRIDLTPGTHVRRSFDRFLVNVVHGSGWICSPLDLQLTLRDRDGYAEPLIARAIRKLTPEEVAAIPRADLPG